MGVPTAKEWFDRGDEFHYTALHLVTPQHQTMAPIFGRPHVVLKAFACEAYFKSLICLEQTRPPPRKHDLETLFDALSPESRRRIRDLWNETSAPKLRKLKVQPDRPRDVEVKSSLRGVLRQSADAFIQFRYHGTGEKTAFTVMSLPTFVRKRVVELRPDWAHKDPHPLAWLNT
jgi:hypothetical protein